MAYKFEYGDKVICCDKNYTKIFHGTVHQDLGRSYSVEVKTFDGVYYTTKFSKPLVYDGVDEDKSFAEIQTDAKIRFNNKLSNKRNMELCDNIVKMFDNINTWDENYSSDDIAGFSQMYRNVICLEAHGKDKDYIDYVKKAVFNHWTKIFSYNEYKKLKLLLAKFEKSMYCSCLIDYKKPNIKYMNLGICNIFDKLIVNLK